MAIIPPESSTTSSNPSAGVQMYTSGQYVNIPCMFNPTRVHCQYLSTMFSQIKIWDGNFIGEAMVIGGHNVPMSTRHCLVQIFTVQLFFSYCDPQVPLSNAPIIICPDSSLFSFRLLWLQDCGVFSSRFTDAIILQGPGRFKDYLHVISDTKIKSNQGEWSVNIYSTFLGHPSSRAMWVALDMCHCWVARWVEESVKSVLKDSAFQGEHGRLGMWVLSVIWRWLLCCFVSCLRCVNCLDFN